MKFNCGLTDLEKSKERYRLESVKKRHLTFWHRKFLWFPTRMNDANGDKTHDCRWLETVERKGIPWEDFGYGLPFGLSFIKFWQYRPIGEK